MSAVRTALVTGGCGFVGRHFTKYLLGQGYRVTAVDDLSTGLPPAKWPEHTKPSAAEAGRLEFVHADFREYAKTATADFDLVVHLAAVVGGRLVIEGDPLSVATDLAIDSIFFNWAVKTKPFPRQVLYFSSSAAYPIIEQRREHHQPLSEEMIDFRATIGVPDLTYGWSKLSGEFLAGLAVERYGLDVRTFRPFSGYGEDQDLTYPFPSIVRRVGNKESPLVVWGSGDQLRDFIHIDDCIEAVFKSLAVTKNGQALNLGSGVGTSFIELAKAACKVVGHDAPVINDATKPEGVFARVGDCRKMLAIHTPAISLEEGLRRTWEYQKRVGILT